MGIDEAYISLLVDRFYRDIRQNPLIGPLFEAAIGENWDRHLVQMKSFWMSVALNRGCYNGKPVPKHQSLTDRKPSAQPWHFDIWLALFRKALEDTAPSPAVVPYFMDRAEPIAESLKRAMFDRVAWSPQP